MVLIANRFLVKATINLIPLGVDGPLLIVHYSTKGNLGQAVKWKITLISVAYPKKNSSLQN